MAMDEVTKKLEALYAARMARPKYRYTVPADLAKERGVTSITMVELTTQDELTAYRASSGDEGGRLSMELAKLSLFQINDKNVDSTEIDQEMDRLGPKLRSLMLTAYNTLHSATVPELVDFLGSRSVIVE